MSSFSSKPKYLVLNQIIILDWYDGIVRGIGEAQEGHYLLTLAAGDIAARRRTYVVIDLDQATREQMKLLADWQNKETSKPEEWVHFNRIFDEYLKSYSGVVYLLKEEPVEGRDLLLKPIALDHLKHLQHFDLDKAFSSTAQTFWFNLA